MELLFLFIRHRRDRRKPSGFLPMPPSDLKNRSCSASSFVIAAFRWVAHRLPACVRASHVLVAASAPQRTFVDWPFRKSVGCRSEVHISRKLVVARRDNQDARSECPPNRVASRLTRTDCLRWVRGLLRKTWRQLPPIKPTVTFP